MVIIKFMIITDIIWGKISIKDKETVELIKHPAMQRLKKIWISAYGYLFEQKRSSTRFEHSIGVYYLLKHFNADFAEQVAGLIHDISHTAFSHVSTYVLQEKWQENESHEQFQHEFIIKSGLKDLLNKFGFDEEQLLHTDKWGLLENKLPDICADRLDYTIRDGLHLQILSRQDADKIIKGLTVLDGSFVFKNKESAFLYAFAFYLLNLQHYGSATEAYFNHNFGSLVKRAMQKGVLSTGDWFLNDVEVIKKIKKTTDKEIKNWFKKFNNNLVVYEDREDPTVILSKKIRVVDPKVIMPGGEPKRLSEVDAVYKRLMEEYLATHQKHELPIKYYYKSK